MNDWKKIWNSRQASDVFADKDTEGVFMYLKNRMGITFHTDNGFAGFRDQFEANLTKMRGFDTAWAPKSYFEVGCGSGSYLYYLACRDRSLMLGGVDYSAPLVNTARNALLLLNTGVGITELGCMEASELDTTVKYDCVYSRSVFQYFPSADYGISVAQKMLEKANRCVGIFDLFDVQKKEAFLDYRRSTIEDYDRKYAQTPHQFYAKELFLKIAEANHCDVLFSRDALPGYWNEPFVYDVYLYKRG